MTSGIKTILGVQLPACERICFILTFFFALLVYMARQAPVTLWIAPSSCVQVVEINHM
jgi:hypothetical protein